MVEIRNLSAGYPGNEVIKKLDLDFPEGQLTAIAGPNGCGKSTLLKAVAGILPAAGEIFLEGENLAGMPARLRARRIAYLPQTRTVPEITVERFVLHGRFPYLSYPRRYKQADYRAARAAMEQMKITHLAGRLLPSLSGGERQKVYIAMILAQQTQVVLMDEPTSYLDISYKFDVINMARELKEAGKTVVMVLHDLDLALRYADRVVLMEAGTVRRCGCPEELIRSGLLEEVFSIRVGQAETEDGRQYYFLPKRKRAVLLVSFGTVDDGARERFLKPLEEEVRAAFPDRKVCRAYTGAVVIEKMNRRGIPAHSPETALEQLRREGVEQVTVLPAFLVPGGEYRRLLERLEPWKSAFSGLTVEKTLLSEPEDIQQLARILSGRYQSGDEAVLFMGHGTRGEGNEWYSHLERALRMEGMAHGYVALMHGGPELADVLDQISGAGYTSVRLVPLMLTAGSHAAKHMAGDSDRSWKNRCEAAGLKALPQLTGLGELAQVREMYLRKLLK